MPIFIFPGDSNHLGRHGVFPAGDVFHLGKRNEAKLQWNETIFVPREDIPKPLKAIQPPTKQRAAGPKTGTVMIKALSAVAAAAIVAAGLTVLPAFTPQVEASVPQALAKGDRLDIHRGCAQQSWPNFDASCLRTADKEAVQQARVVSVNHIR
jgi:hypothetical protein